MCLDRHFWVWPYVVSSGLYLSWMYGWWDLKFRYCLVNVGLQHMDIFNPSSCELFVYPRRQVSIFFLLWTVWKVILCSHAPVIFTHLSVGNRVWRCYLCIQTIVCFSGEVSIVISSKYPMYLFVIIGDNGDPIAKHSFGIYWNPIGSIFYIQNINIFMLSLGAACTCF